MLGVGSSTPEMEGHRRLLSTTRRYEAGMKLEWKDIDDSG